MAKQQKDFKGIAKGVNPFDAEMLNETLADTSKQKSEPVPESIDDNLKPFATRLPESLIERLQRHQYWGRMPIMDTVIESLTMYFEKHDDTNKPLPEAVMKKKQSRKKRGS